MTQPDGQNRAPKRAVRKTIELLNLGMEIATTENGRLVTRNFQRFKYF